MVADIKDLELFNRRYGKAGDRTYGANGLVYELVPGKKRLRWKLVGSTNEEEYRGKFVVLVGEYQQKINRYQDNFARASTAEGRPREGAEKWHYYYKKKIEDGYHELLDELLPERHAVKNFGRSKDGYLQDGYGTYVLLKVMHYYKVPLDAIGIGARSWPKKDLSGTIFFDKTMEMVDAFRQDKLNKYAGVLYPDEHDIWMASQTKISFPAKIRLLMELLETNVEHDHEVGQSKEYLADLDAVNGLVKKIVRRNIKKHSTKLGSYFNLFRYLGMDLVLVINYLGQYLPAMVLAKAPGTVGAYDFSHVAGTTKIGFGYGIRYLIEFEYVREPYLWDWNQKN